jgi:hypothetical protein
MSLTGTLRSRGGQARMKLSMRACLPTAMGHEIVDFAYGPTLS